MTKNERLVKLIKEAINIAGCKDAWKFEVGEDLPDCIWCEWSRKAIIELETEDAS